MKKLLLGIVGAFLLCASPALAQYTSVYGYASQGGKSVVVGGQPPTATKWLQTYPGATLQVCIYNTSCATLATIYTSPSGGTKSNPFTVDVNTAFFEFYVASGTYDLRFSGGGIPTPFTISGITIGSGSGGGCSPVGPLNGVIYNSPLGSCADSSKFTTNSSAQVDINGGGTFEIDAPITPVNDFTFGQGTQFYVTSDSANYDGSTSDGFTAYVSDTAVPAQTSGALSATNVTVASGLLTLAVTNASTLFTGPSTYAYLTGFHTATFLNGTTVQVLNASTTTLYANTSAGNYSSTADTGTVELITSSNPNPFYSNFGCSLAGSCIGFQSDSQYFTENQHASTVIDFYGQAYGDGPDYGYGTDIAEHLFVKTESAQFLAESSGAGSNQHQYAYKVGNPHATPFFWVGQGGDVYSRLSYANVASTTVGSCTISPGLSDCSAGVNNAGLGPPASETITFTVCQTGALYDTFDWTLDGSFPTCSSPHMFAANAGSPITLADDIYIEFVSATGHTLNATGTIPVTVALGTTLAAQGGTYLYSTALPQPGSPAVTPNPTGSTTWAYCVSESWNGVTTQCSSATSITDGPATLNMSNYNNVAVGNTNSNPAIECTLYRTVASGTPSTTGIIAGPSVALCGTTVADTGLTGDNSAYPTTNLTGHTVIADGYIETPAGVQFHLPGISGTGCIGIASGVVLTSASACSGTGTVAWSSLTNATANLSLSNGTHSTTFNQTTTATWDWANVTAATSGAAQNSPTLEVSGQYWNGSASANDAWTYLDYIQNGTNGKSSLVLQHSGTSGAADVAVANYLSVQTLATATSVPACYNTTIDQFSYSTFATCTGVVLTGQANTYTAAKTQTFGASSTAAASINIPTGAAPSSPNSGDFWNASGVIQYYDGSNTNSIVRIQGPVTNGHCPQFSGTTGVINDSGGSCSGGGGSSLFTSWQFASQTAITGSGQYFQLAIGTGITSSYSGSGSSGSPFIGTVSLANPSATTIGGIESFAAQSHKWINTISTSGVPSATQPASTDLSDNGSVLPCTFFGAANCAITIAGTSVSLGGSTSSLPVPGVIGGTTPAAAHFTTASVTGQFTSTLATGTAPLVVASTTAVANLNASLLLGNTWAIPGAIGSTTPNSVAATTLSASSTVSGSGFSLYLASPPAIGGGSPAAGTFTALVATTSVGGTGFTTYLASPPAIGGTAPNAGTFTNLLATGILDGKAPVTLTTGTGGTLGGTYNSGYTLNQNPTSGTAITYTLPSAVAGRQYCVGNSDSAGTADTGTITLVTSGVGQYIHYNGARSGSGGYVISAGAAGDKACVVGTTANDWEFYPQFGSWTLH